MLNALPMWRHNCGLHAMKDLRDRLVGDPSVFILFPEGGRSRTGQMGQFKPGLGMLVAGTGVSVYPACITGAFECWPATQRRPSPGRVSVRVGDPLMFADEPNRRRGWEKIANDSAEAVRALEG